MAPRLACDLEALKPMAERYRVFTTCFSTGYNLSTMSPRSPFTLSISTVLGITGLGMGLLTCPSIVSASDDLHIEITKKGQEQVVITQGAREWFMLIEVTPENSVVLRQEKDTIRIVWMK